tara:strand:- start:1695 stop:2579 length:885 start_codon:yes stop_codon:yes gene_type:complete
MAEQLKLFEDLPILNENINKPKKPDPTVPTKAEEIAGMKQLEKYATQPNSKGAWKNFVKANEKAEAEEKALMQFAIERSNDKVKGYPKKDLKKEKPHYLYNPVTNNLDNVNDPNYLKQKPKPRVETVLERIDRVQYEYGDSDKKPAHYNDPNIVDYENYKQPPRAFNSDDKSTYPSDRNQKQRLSTWDAMVQTAKTPEEKREIREVLHRDYKKSKGANMSDKELRMIGKHPDQLKELIKPIVTPTPAPYVPPAQPKIPLEEIIRRNADAKLRQQQLDHDYRYGKGGLASLSRPK